MTIWSRREEALVHRTVDGSVVWPPALEAPLLLSKTCSTIWEMLAAPRSSDDLVRDLASLYATDAATVRRPVEEALAELARGGALETREAGDP